MKINNTGFISNDQQTALFNNRNRQLIQQPRTATV